MATIYAKLIIQYKFEYQTVFSARFGEEDEIGCMLEEIEFLVNLRIN